MISFAVTVKLICTFVFAYTKCWFSHDETFLLLTGDVDNVTKELKKTFIDTFKKTDEEFLKEATKL